MSEASLELQFKGLQDRVALLEARLDAIGIPTNR